MTNRSPLCYTLDFIGIIGLTGAGLALAGALWLTASVAEPLLFSAFTYCLMGATAAFLAARTVEIAAVLRAGSAEAAHAPLALPDNVEALPERDDLQRAA